ncbi:MAG: InlB B-repeat-containing protein [Bacteroidota bacterium]|nr:hypothetical protein [Algoriphagus sp.]
MGFIPSCQEREFNNPFDPQVPKTLTTSVLPSGAGRINVSPALSSYPTGEVVTLTPEPNQHWVFKNWEGDASGTTNPLRLTMSSNKSVVAIFIRRNYPLNLTVEGEGTVSERIVFTPSGREYPFGTIVELTPVPKQGWIFDSWSGDLTGKNVPQNITVDNPKNVRAKFIQQQISNLACASALNSGNLVATLPATGVSTVIPYTTLSGGSYVGQSINSTGVTGLTATLAQGNFSSTSGNLTFNITGNPSGPGTASFAISIGGQSCTFTRVVSPLGTISGLNCPEATNNGLLINGAAASGVSSVIPYSGGNGGGHSGQVVTSTGIGGLTATLAPGSFANGSGLLTYTITGTPSGSGTASFALNIGGRTCALTMTVESSGTSAYPQNTVFCGGIQTAIIPVTNPITGRTWMDRNLGASKKATNPSDTGSFGDLYQWGRRADGHQCRNSSISSTLSASNTPSTGNFIISPNTPYDWRNPQNSNLWQGVSGTNNPCPSGYRLPTESEWNAEIQSWDGKNSSGASASPLNLPAAGYRWYDDGLGGGIGSWGSYWTSNVSGNRSIALDFNSGGAGFFDYERAWGYSVRCIRN